MHKILSLTIFACLFANSTFAGTSTTYTNQTLGFEIIQNTMEESTMICNQQYICLYFLPTERNGNKVTFQEVSGKCELTMEWFEKDFGEGKTKNDSMLKLSAQVVQVVKGEENCQLNQLHPDGTVKQQRSLTGLYQ